MGKVYEITHQQYAHIICELHETKKILKAITEEIDAKKKSLNEAKALNEGIIDTLKRYLSVGMLPIGIMVSLLLSQKASPEQLTQAGVPPQQVQQAVQMAQQKTKQIPTMQQAQQQVQQGQGVVKEMFDDFDQLKNNAHSPLATMAKTRKNVITSFELMPLEKQAEFLFNKENYWNIKDAMVKQFTKKLSLLQNPEQIATYLIKLITSVKGIMKLIDPALLNNTAVLDLIKTKNPQVFNYLSTAKNKMNVG